MTVAAEITRVRYALDDPDGTLHSDAYLIEVYNRIIQGFLNPYLIGRGSFLAYATADITLSAGVTFYDLAADCLMPISFWMDGQTWRLKQIRNPRDRIQYPGTGGTPTRYVLMGGQAGFYDPQPGTGTVHYDYWSKPTMLTTTTDAMPYSDKLNPVINEMAVFLARNDEEAQTTVEQSLNNLMEVRMGNYIGTEGDDPATVLDCGDFRY